MIVKRLNLGNFINEFRRYDRDNYTYEGYKALYNYINETYEHMGQTYELDVIALCCDYTEYNDVEEIQSEYGEDFDISSISRRTLVIELENGGFLIQNF